MAEKAKTKRRNFDKRIEAAMKKIDALNGEGVKVGNYIKSLSVIRGDLAMLEKRLGALEENLDIANEKVKEHKKKVAQRANNAGCNRSDCIDVRRTEVQSLG